MKLFQTTHKASRRAETLVIGSLLFCVSVLGTAQEINSSSEYSAGMNAYIGAQYEEAKQYWLSAANNGNAKAMFNLGLLHERSQIANAEELTAEQWFEKAGNAGYAAADYHLALRLQAQGKHARATRLLERAASSGYVLAQEVVSSGYQQGSLSDVQEYKPQPAKAKIAASVPAKAAVVAEVQAESTSLTSASTDSSRGYNRESWLLGQSPEFWTIQMLAFSDETKVQSFIDQHSLHQNAAYFAESNDGGSVYKLVYGAYISKERADQARSDLSAGLKKHGPWLRELKAVQAIIRDQK